MSDMISMNPTDVVKFIEKYWLEKTGLFSALIITILIEISFTVLAKANWLLTLIILICSVLFIVIIWLMSRQPPKTPRGKIGFLVSIYSADNLESEKLCEDFIIPLRRLVKTGKAGNAFHFMELPQHLAKNIIEPDDAQALRVRSRAHFVLYGRVRLRRIEEKEYHVIDLEGLVAHRPVPEHISRALTQEFSELLPRRVQIQTENDLLSFQFTSEWADIVGKYIIGIAAACSGDLDYAETLYVDALDRVKTQNKAFPVYSKLIQRIPTRISELYEVRAQAAYRAWSASHDQQHIERMGVCLEKVEESRKEISGMVNLRAIYVFLKERDVDKAIMLLRKVENDNDGVWHCNLGFLHSYTGNLRTAIRHYRKGIILEVEPEIMVTIENFISWILQQEPNKYQLHYTLGFIHWKAKVDKVQARKDFQQFLRAADSNQFSKEIELANQWLEEMNRSEKYVKTFKLI